jgi:hypothetical protein
VEEWVVLPADRTSALCRGASRQERLPKREAGSSRRNPRRSHERRGGPVRVSVVARGESSVRFQTLGSSRFAQTKCVAADNLPLNPLFSQSDFRRCSGSPNRPRPRSPPRPRACIPSRRNSFTPSPLAWWSRLQARQTFNISHQGKLATAKLNGNAVGTFVW